MIKSDSISTMLTYITKGYNGDKKVKQSYKDEKTAMWEILWLHKKNDQMWLWLLIFQGSRPKGFDHKATFYIVLLLRPLIHSNTSN